MVYFWPMLRRQLIMAQTVAILQGKRSIKAKVVKVTKARAESREINTAHLDGQCENCTPNVVSTIAASRLAHLSSTPVECHLLCCFRDPGWRP
jgi:hypothetical protein